MYYKVVEGHKIFWPAVDTLSSSLVTPLYLSLDLDLDGHKILCFLSHCRHLRQTYFQLNFR